MGTRGDKAVRKYLKEGNVRKYVNETLRFAYRGLADELEKDPEVKTFVDALDYDGLVNYLFKIRHSYDVRITFKQIRRLAYELINREKARS